MAAHLAARDEIRHAAVMKFFAEREGARVPPARVARQRRRSLEAIAIENAVEGCVGETFGAAVARFQSQRAANRGLRLAMKGIADDETRHAEFSWELARWLGPRLSLAARTRVKRARSRAVRTLARSVAVEIDGTAIATLGLPSAAQATALVAYLRKSVWA
jgi:hypothetical protein